MTMRTAFDAILLFTVAGEFILPFILKFFCTGYDSRKMVMSALGSEKSPVRRIYNLWLIWLGIFLVIVAVVFFERMKQISVILAAMIFVVITMFAVGAGLLAGLFSVSETKKFDKLSAKVHGVGAAIGFMALLFLPLLCGIAELKQDNMVLAIVYFVAFIVAVIMFVLFVMSDKVQFKGTFVEYEGLWERAALFAMYVPFIVYSYMYIIN